MTLVCVTYSVFKRETVGNWRERPVFRKQIQKPFLRAKQKPKVGEVGKQAFRECVVWFTKQMITLNCDRIDRTETRQNA